MSLLKKKELHGKSPAYWATQSGPSSLFWWALLLLCSPAQLVQTPASFIRGLVCFFFLVLRSTRQGAWGTALALPVFQVPLVAIRRWELTRIQAVSLYSMVRGFGRDNQTPTSLRGRLVRRWPAGRCCGRRLDGAYPRACSQPKVRMLSYNRAKLILRTMFPTPEISPFGL